MPHTNKVERGQEYKRRRGEVGNSKYPHQQSEGRREGGHRSHALAHKNSRTPSIKNQIRGLQRLLAKPGIDEAKKRQVEKQLSALQSNMKSHQQQELERKYAVKYHKVKFFEKRKLMRKLKAAYKKLGLLEDGTEAPEDCTELQAQREKLEQDLKYVIYFPKDKRYIGIFPGEGKDDEGTIKTRALMMEKALQAGERSGFKGFHSFVAKHVIGSESGEDGAAASNSADGRPSGAQSEGAGTDGESSDEELPVMEEDDFFQS